MFFFTRALTKSMVRVEQAVSVMLERVETEAEISNTSTTPSKILADLPYSTIRHNVILPPAGHLVPKKQVGK